MLSAQISNKLCAGIRLAQFTIVITDFRLLDQDTHRPQSHSYPCPGSGLSQCHIDFIRCLRTAGHGIDKNRGRLRDAGNTSADVNLVNRCFRERAMDEFASIKFPVDFLLVPGRVFPRKFLCKADMVIFAA